MSREQQQKTKIKICGLKCPEDIAYVNEAKPDYCGFIIEFPKSSRNVTGDQVRILIAELDKNIIPVGVFVNAAPERVEELLLDGTIRIAQLHGQEDDDYIRSNPTDNVLRELKKSHCFKNEKRRALTKQKQESLLFQCEHSQDTGRYETSANTS